MLHVKVGKVHRITAERPGIQEMEVLLSGIGVLEKAIYYKKNDTHDIKVQEGDTVLINTTAVDLGLGTGGYHFVIAKMNDSLSLSFTDEDSHQTNDDLHPTKWGHIMKMRYSPWQLAVDSIEEQASPMHSVFCDESLSLEMTPVIMGELHSLLPILAMAIHRLAPEQKLIYVMPDGSALPMKLSNHVHQLKQMGILSATVSSGHAWGGDYESVNLHTGLLAAKHVGKADIILCLLGPGVVGTSTPFGFSGIQVAEMIHAVSSLGGIPIVVPRISFADSRTRHLGLSHHTRTVLKRFALAPTLVTVPIFQSDNWNEILQKQIFADQLKEKHLIISDNAPNITKLMEIQNEYPEDIISMGRTIKEDPAPHQTAYAAAEFAVFSGRWAKTRADSIATSAAFTTSSDTASSGNISNYESVPGFSSSATSLQPDHNVLATLAKSWSYQRIVEE